MKTITKVLLTGITALALTACGGSSGGDSAQDAAIAKISNYAQNGGEAPTIQDYLDAGVTGVTDIDAINDYIRDLTKNDVDTALEIQGHVNTLSIELTGNIPPIAKANGAPLTVTEGEEVKFNATNSTDTDGQIVSYKWSEGAVTLANVPSFSKTNLSIGIHTITLTVTDDSGATDTDTVTVTVNSAVPAVPAAITHNGITYYEVTSPETGRVWLDRNLGASQVCTSSNDAACYGDYYAYQEDIIGNHVSWSATDGSSVCPIGFRIPTSSELQDELDGGITNHTTAFDSFLKIPLAGYQAFNNGAIYQQGDWGYLWTNGSVLTLFIGRLHPTATIEYRDPNFEFPLRCIQPTI